MGKRTQYIVYKYTDKAFIHPNTFSTFARCFFSFNVKNRLFCMICEQTCALKTIIQQPPIFYMCEEKLRESFVAEVNQLVGPHFLETKLKSTK